MRRWLRRLLVGVLQYGALSLAIGSWPALQAVMLALFDLVLLAGAITLFVGLVYYFWSKAAAAFWPALVATFNRTGERIVPMITAAVLFGLYAARHVWDPHAPRFPNWDSPAARVGAALGAFLCIIYFSELGYSLGFPPGLKLRRRFEVATRFKYIALILAAGTAFPAAATPRFQWVAIPVFASATLYTIFALATTRQVALRAFEGLPPVDGSMPALFDGPEAFAIHVTDVHLVAEGASRIEGGNGGNRRLAGLVSFVIARPPTLLLITGDFTDHGFPNEYEEAKRILEPLRKAAPTTSILVAPGNHDLGMAYSATDQMIVLHSQNFEGGGPQGSNGMLLRRYLEEAARLHPSLKDCTGQLLQQRLDRENARDTLFEELLDRIRERLLVNILDAAAKSELAAAGEASYPGGAPSAGWQRLPWIPGGFRGMYLPSWYAGTWYDAFPLHTSLDDGHTDVLILNSVSPDPTLSGSAWGGLGDSQLARLREMVMKSAAHRCLILVHHAPFRWADERPPTMASEDLQRWGFLAFGAEDVCVLLDILKEGVSLGKDVFLFCGHRHGFKLDPSDRTEVASCRFGEHHEICVVEGASLADEDTPVIAAIIDNGCLELRAVVLR